MNKFLKYTLIGLGGLAAVLVALVAFVAATFNPNEHKPQIQQLVQEKLGRTLKIDGDIKLTFYPSLGAELGKLSLSERAGEKEFSSVESARVALQLMPLLSKELVVSKIEVHGLRAHLVKHKDGSSNFDDLLGKKAAEPKAPAPAAAPQARRGAQFDIDHVLIDEAALSYADEASGAQYEIGKLTLKTGKIAAATPVDIELSAQGVTASKPKARLDALLKARLEFDADGKRFKLDPLDLSLKGEAAGLSALTLHLAGAFEGDAKALQSREITLELDAKLGERALKAKLSGPLAAELDAEKFDFTKLVASVAVSNALAPGATLNLALSGAAHADLPKQSAHLDFSGKLDDTGIHGKAGVTHFDPPSYVFDLNLDKLDIDRYTGAKPSAVAVDGKAAAAKPEQPLDVSALKTLNARGSLKVGALKAANLHVQDLRVDLKADNGRLDLSPIAANLYQGTASGSLSLVAAASPQVVLKQTLTGISIGPLLKDAIDKDLLEGRGNVAIDLAGQGATVSAIKRALNGTASLNLADGALKGINIGAAIRKARENLAAFKGEAQTQAANESDKTDFSELKASFTVKSGVAHNNDLSLKSPLLRLGGEGDIDLGAGRIDYLAKATLVASAAGQGGKSAAELKGVTLPVRISGPFAALSYKLDINALLHEKLDEKKDELKSKLQDKLKEQLRGLLGR